MKLIFTLYAYIWMSVSMIMGQSGGPNANQFQDVSFKGCPDLEIIETVTNVLCSGECDGSIVVNDILEAVFPVAYLWSTNETTSSISGLCPGTYAVTITDDDNCVVTETFILAAPQVLSVTADATDETIQGLNDGTA
ncbi:MAG: hypothetical protein M3R25_03435, partial [Bacteroidota bacterium]|nr:hypothetical protein [Bacteroidota bacterium]